MIFELDIRIGDKDKGRHAQIKIDDLTSASTKPKGAEISLQGKEMWTMIKRGQVDIEGATPCEQFYALAG